MLQIETNPVRVAVGAWFSIAIPLRHMFFDLFVDDLTFDGAGEFLTFSVVRDFERCVL